MPIWLRKYTFHQMEEHYKKEKEEYDKASRKSKVKGPAIKKPSYTSPFTYLYKPHPSLYYSFLSYSPS